MSHLSHLHCWQVSLGLVRNGMTSFDALPSKALCPAPRGAGLPTDLPVRPAPLITQTMSADADGYAARTVFRNLSTCSVRRMPSPESDCAADRTCDEAEPVSLAPR